VTLLLKASDEEQHSVLHFLWVQGLSGNAIHCEICPGYGNKCFGRPAIHVFERCLLKVRKVCHLAGMAALLLQQPLKRLQQ